MLGDAQAVVNGCIAAGGIQSSSSAHLVGGHARGFLKGFWRVLGLQNESFPLFELGQVAPFPDVILPCQAFLHNDMRQGVEDCGVGSRTEGQMELGFDMRLANEVDPARIDDD